MVSTSAKRIPAFRMTRRLVAIPVVCTTGRVRLLPGLYPQAVHVFSPAPSRFRRLHNLHKAGGNLVVYHSRQNDYRCKSFINSKTISVSKKYRNNVAELINSKNNNVRMKLQTLQMIRIFIECTIMVG